MGGGSFGGRGGRSGGLFGGGFSRGPSRPSMGGWRPTYRSSWGPRRPAPGPGPSPGGCGCLWSTFLLPILLVLVLFVLFSGVGNVLHGGSFLPSGSEDITRSTVKREPLDKAYVNETGYYTDELGWIRSGSTLEKGMKDCYQETGVQPYLYITDTVNGTTSPTSSDMETACQALYDQLFTDEGHMLLLFQEYNSSGNYNMWYVCGKQAKTVLDSEAMDILMDYVDYYYYSDLDEDEMFAQAFQKAGDRIMSVTRPAWMMPAIILGVVLLVALLYSWWKKAKQQKNREAEQTKKILETDLSTFEDKELKDLENKYK